MYTRKKKDVLKVPELSKAGLEPVDELGEMILITHSTLESTSHAPGF
jgi:hypothetical protein